MKLIRLRLIHEEIFSWPLLPMDRMLSKVGNFRGGPRFLLQPSGKR